VNVIAGVALVTALAPTAPALAGIIVHDRATSGGAVAPEIRTLVGPEYRSVVGPEYRTVTGADCGAAIGPEVRTIIDPNFRNATGCVIGPDIAPAPAR
jgi:hypothetical protein